MPSKRNGEPSTAHFTMGRVGSAALLLTACTSDLSAPDNFTDSLGSATVGAGDLNIECGDVGDGAVSATYTHMPGVTGGDLATRQFTGEGLPPGLEVNPTSGTVFGIPTEEGMFTATISVTDGQGGAAETMCDINIAQALNVPLSLPLPCIQWDAQNQQSLLDLVEGGDGSAITCAHPNSTGDGKIPTTLAINEQTCLMDGSLDETRFGTWVWVIEATQSGYSINVPFCATQPTPEAGSDDLSLRLDGIDNQDLVPGIHVFDPDAPLNWGGTSGMDSPRWEIRGPCAQNACFFGFLFGLNSSPYNLIDSMTFLDDAALLNDAMGNPIGFFHHMTALGDAPGDAFRLRPFTVNVELDYCISGMDGPCDGADNIGANAVTHYIFSILAFPQGLAPS